MYSVEIKTSQDWALRRQPLRADKWTPIKRVPTKQEAEKEIAWLTLGFEDVHLSKGLVVNMRITQSNNTLWEQEKKY